MSGKRWSQVKAEQKLHRRLQIALTDVLGPNHSDLAHLCAEAVIQELGLGFDETEFVSFDGSTGTANRFITRWEIHKHD